MNRFFRWLCRTEPEYVPMIDRYDLMIPLQESEDNKMTRWIEREAQEMYRIWQLNDDQIHIFNPPGALYMIYHSETAVYLNKSFHDLIRARYRELINSHVGPRPESWWDRYKKSQYALNGRSESQVPESNEGHNTGQD